MDNEKIDVEMSETNVMTKTTTNSSSSSPDSKSNQKESNEQTVNADSFPESITVKFVTNTYKDKAPDTTFKVPSDLTPSGLSEIVNHLLNKDEQQVPFEFLIELKAFNDQYQPVSSSVTRKVFLRSSLKRFFIRIQQYPESVVTLEYIEAYPSPKQVDTVPHEDWVCAIDISNDDKLLVTGCYDGLCRVIDNQNGDILASCKHQTSAGPVRSISITKSPTLSYMYYIATSTNDQYGRLWQFNLEEKRITFLSTMKAHSDTLNDILFNTKGNMAITSSSDKLIKIWDIYSKEQKDEREAKRQKTETGESFEPVAIGTLKGHVLPVTSLEWHQNTVLSGSQDHTVKLWDIETGESVATLQGSKVVSSLSFNPSLKLCLTTHPDFLIRMWDTRTNNVINRASLFKSHKGWVRKVHWNPNSEYQFASCADDNMVKVWDLRSALPLHSLPHHVLEEGETQTTEVKVLALKWWHSSHKLVSGGTNCKLKRFTFSEATH